MFQHPIEKLIAETLTELRDSNVPPKLWPILIAARLQARYTPSMNEECIRLRDEYRDSVSAYMNAIHNQEIGRLEALQASDPQTIAAWLAAVDAVEAINKNRHVAQQRLRIALCQQA